MKDIYLSLHTHNHHTSHAQYTSNVVPKMNPRSGNADCKRTQATSSAKKELSILPSANRRIVRLVFEKNDKGVMFFTCKNITAASSLEKAYSSTLPKHG